MSNSYVRVEVICDREGFWLKPHCDIKEKLMSCLLFVNKHNESEELGTDFYDSDLKLIKTLPYKDNYFDFVLTGSLVGLVLAYIIKSYALSSSTIEAGYQRINMRIDDVAKTLKTSGWSLLSSVHLPLLKTSFLTSMLLVVSEVIKELPATLILRPFNFDTLAVYTYIYAAEERMYDAAAPSIAIVMVGLIPIIILTRMIRSSRPASRD